MQYFTHCALMVIILVHLKESQHKKTHLKNITDEFMKGGKIPCNTLIRPTMSQFVPTGPPWHLERSGGYVIVIHSAFYDDRPQGGKLPTIHLLSISDVDVRTSLYCYIWYLGLDDPYVAKAQLSRISYNYRNPGELKQHFNTTKFFIDYIVSCTLPTSRVIPTHVSLTAEHCKASDILIPVTVPQKPTTTLDFGVCVGPSFGHIDEAKIVEWFELNKIFGVKEFSIYNVSIDASMNKVFAHYLSNKELIVHEMPPIVPRYDDIAAYLNTLPAENHCLFTNMYRYKHIVVIDFDEYITPKQNNTYSQLVGILNKSYNNKPWSSYTFFNQYFFNGYPLDTSQPEYLSVLQKRIRFDTSDYMWVPKSFINPHNCMFFMPHHCFKSFSGIPLVTRVPANLATNHHYRECYYPPKHKYSGKCKQQLEIRNPDNTMLLYKSELETKVKQVLRKIGYFD